MIVVEGGTSAEWSLHDRIFLSYEIAYEKHSKFYRFDLPLFCGPQERSRKIPAKFPTIFPAKNQANFTDELLQARRENGSREQSKSLALPLKAQVIFFHNETSQASPP